MNPLCFAVVPLKFPQHVNEQLAAFLFSFDPNQLACLGVQSTCQITLFVLARCEDGFLLARHHPVRADFRIQVNVDFVLIDGHFIVGQRFEQRMNCPQTPVFGLFRPRATDQRFGAAAAGTNSF